jgi:hypothetical protein
MKQLCNKMPAGTDAAAARGGNRNAGWCGGSAGRRTVRRLAGVLACEKAPPHCGSGKDATGRRN